jgi:streptogramin lyase
MIATTPARILRSRYFFNRRFVLEPTMRIPSVLPAVGVLFAALLMTGCGTVRNTSNGPVTVVGAALQGKAYGGQQPVVGATVQLYQVGTTGYGAGATPLITTPPQTGTDGGFAITGLYHCTSGSQIYMTVTGGNAGGGANSALAMMAGLGLCDNLTASSYIWIDEVTTVGAVWALSPFMNGMNIGAPSSNQAGLATAFGYIPQIVNNATGTAPGLSLPPGAVVPTSEINTLSDILASCINSAGASSQACTKLFANAKSTGGAAPSETLTAAVNIAQNPGSNVSALLGLTTPQSPFQPTLAMVTDFTMGVTYPVGATSSTPSALAVDASGDIWVADKGANAVTELTPVGTTATYTAGSMNAPSALAIDTTGDVWIANSGNNTLTELSSSGTNVGSSPFSGGGLNMPSSIAVDPFGDIWVVNSGANILSVFSNNGTPLSASGYTVPGTGMIGVAVDQQ